MCPSVVGTQVGFDEEIDIDYLKLNGGGGINPAYLPRDPKNGCAPVYPHNYIRVNTIFEVARTAGLYTAWSDKHPSYDFVNGPSGLGVIDLYSPEINSIPVPLPNVKVPLAGACSPLPDPGAATSSTPGPTASRTSSATTAQGAGDPQGNRRGMNSSGNAAQVPNLFGMNFQSVSVGQKLVEKVTTPAPTTTTTVSPTTTVTGGYLDAAGTPTPALLAEIQYVDAAIGQMVKELKDASLLNTTAIIITAKHGQSPIDPNRVQRIPHDAPAKMAPSTYLAGQSIGVAQADEDDVSLLWLTDDSAPGVLAAVNALEGAAATVGFDGGQIYYGASLETLLDNPQLDLRTPDIVIAPNVGVIYTGGGKKIAEHGGFAHDDTNVMLLVSNPTLHQSLVTTPVATAQVAPTVLNLLGLNPNALQAVVAEGTQALPVVP